VQTKQRERNSGQSRTVGVLRGVRKATSALDEVLMNVLLKALLFNHFLFSNSNTNSAFLIDVVLETKVLDRKYFKLILHICLCKFHVSTSNKPLCMYGMYTGYVSMYMYVCNKVSFFGL